ncbi:sialidase family protein [Brachyspira catarrhinii]|uniref:exo-alpha-sialidase n=1 Tax=Brachyspira catarrhinii TaxID=2528966 RepID=A0ABY2TSU0_9SPIR|nr:sialidase family protein [Brachyspira catarrhinii]TKZ34509.1 exo-alpha-sialidase [Brachyspira catarrhinii]
MKTAKKVLLFIMGLMIVSMIILLSCKNRYTGPGDKGIFEEGSSEETGENGGGDIGSGLPAGYLTQDEQYEPMNPDSKKVVLFTGDNYRIPALTITANKMILAAVGTGTGQNHIAIKRSSDMGQTWTEVQANYEGFNGMYTHPFFINGYDGSVLMGVATTNATNNKTIIYKSTDDGMSWNKLTDIDTNSVNNGNVEVFNGHVTYGQGITLRHGNNANKLLFPYFFGTNAKENGFTATMCSTDGGQTFTQLGAPYGKFTSHETKFIELANGDILLNVRATTGQTYWMKSTDCGENWNITTSGGTETSGNNNSGKHADFTRYEFNGKDIKLGGEKYALSVISKRDETGYNVRMTFNDFGEGVGNFNNKYLYNKDFATNVGGDGYPAITVLPDGTIATLTEETDGIVFRRFNLSWLSSVDGTEGGEDYVDYELDNITK